mgnify:CR=1 FL=1
MVAEYMEKNPQVMSYITLRELSSSQEVTEITVLKTCQSLGIWTASNELENMSSGRNSNRKAGKTMMYWMRNFYH